MLTTYRPTYRYYEFLDWSTYIHKQAEWALSTVINRTDYVAAHIRVADAHWDAADCQHKLNGFPIASVSCGDGLNAINYSSLAQELWYVLRISGDKKKLYISCLLYTSDAADE